MALHKPVTSWETAREMRVNGASLSEIARTIGVTRQAVAKRDKKEGWLNQTGQPASTSGMTPKRAVVMNLRRGCSIKVAAEAAGIHPNTVGGWRKRDLDFDAECRAAISLYGVDRINDLTRASERGDVRATKIALERHQATREDFAPNTANEPVTIILAINRGEGEAEPIIWPQPRTIEGTCTSATDSEQQD